MRCRRSVCDGWSHSRRRDRRRHHVHGGRADRAASRDRAPWGNGADSRRLRLARSVLLLGALCRHRAPVRSRAGRARGAALARCRADRRGHRVRAVVDRHAGPPLRPRARSASGPRADPRRSVCARPAPRVHRARPALRRHLPRHRKSPAHRRNVARLVPVLLRPRTREERLLRERFGSEYEAYARKVPMLLPRPPGRWVGREGGKT